MVGSRGRRPRGGKTTSAQKNKHQEEEEKGERAEYEKSRAQRIKENAERMKSLGIFDLSKKLKPTIPKPSSSSSSVRKTKPTSTSNDPPRRSSRLKDMPQVSYKEKRNLKEKSVKKVEIHIPEGEKPEIYTEEHEKLLGDSKAVWTLLVDGYDEDGQRIYDPVEGKSCHQCRQKTLGHHTECSKCSMLTGQFCGDCLYMRYGENIIEVNQNPNWICPVCRGICNCSRCRREKGWEPTGAIYRKVVTLGFKSVAHYLIQTRGRQSIMEKEGSENSGDEDESIEDGKKETSDNEIKDGMKLHTDEEYRGDDYEEDDDVDDGDNSDE